MLEAVYRARQDLGELGRRDTLSHANGAADVHSVCRLINRRDLHVEQGAKLAIDFSEQFDSTIESAEPEHERQPSRHEPLGSRYLAKHLFPELEQCPRQQTWPFDLRDPF